jgi:LmbE family N-acetylglucosaminyl deacetylase
MGTLVCFHAHPDDESISTGGTIARAKAAGNRVVLVVATGGEHGERPEDLAPERTLAELRFEETHRSAAELGIDAVHFLGYEDSGMTGWPQNAEPGAFMRAPVDEAAERLAAILEAEAATTLTIYDWHGNYGHPDHIAVHRVGARAAELAGTPHVYEATMNRDAVLRFMDMARASGETVEFDPNDTDDGNPFGMPESELTTIVDVTAFIAQKRSSIECHASQVSDSSFFLRMPPEAFAAAFGTEYFIRRGERPADVEPWLAGLSDLS